MLLIQAYYQAALTHIYLDCQKHLFTFVALLHQEAPKWCCQPAVMRRWFNDVPNQLKGKIMRNKTQRPGTRAGIYIPSDSDKQQRQEFRDILLSKSNKELVESYNREKNIFGVHAQMVHIYCLHNIFMERFGESPIIVMNDVAYALGPKIYYSEELDAIFEFAEN